MTQEHPITPPDELLLEWINKHYGCKVDREIGGVERAIATRSARWGADQELEECSAVIHTLYGQYRAYWLRSIRRPKPKSHAEEALEALDDAMIMGHTITTSPAAPTIRAALERLRDLEGGND